jgi:hypothetical protein
MEDTVDFNRGMNNGANGAVSTEKTITTYQHIVQIDSRDCIGVDSLNQAKKAFIEGGGRGESSGLILGVQIGSQSIKIITTQTNSLTNGDIVCVSSVQGLSINGNWKIFNFLVVDGSIPYICSSFEINCTSTNNYAGGGQWFRNADNGYPAITTNTPVIAGNEMIIPLQKRLKAIRSISLNVGIIPRDIIPIQHYFTDLFDNNSSPGISYIGQTSKFITDNLYGMYSTNLSIFRTYIGSFAMPNQSTPPPLNLWNPPLQPIPYQFQTVPTYVSSIGSSYLICSGYGVYDLNDWTAPTRQDTEIVRKKLLMTIICQQNDRDYLISMCNTTSNNVFPFGYGNFQRFLCGPGLQQSYQPGTSDGANPTIPSADWPVAFPSFRGNVWGPYDSPGDRFQKMGLRDTLQDLFLNGDLSNIFGNEVVGVIGSMVMSSPNWGLSSNYNQLTFGNYFTAVNPNILNAMRVVPNGFGALSITAQGFGNPYNVSGFQNAGGMGPGIIGNWSMNGVIGPASFTDPVATGPNSLNSIKSSNSVNNQFIDNRIGWYDLGTGGFISQLGSYFKWVSLNIPATNIVIHAFQFPRNERVQSTNSEAGSSIFNVPIRTIPSTADGGFEYLEGLYALVSQSSDFEYWGQRFLTPLASLDKISLKFCTYKGDPIPLERMLSYNNGYQYDKQSSLINSKRFISLLFKVECYQYTNVGIKQLIDLLGNSMEEDSEEFGVKAGNFEDYGI